MATVTVGVGGYRPLRVSLTAIIRKANSVKVLTSRTPAKLYSYDTLLKGLAQDLQDMAAALRPCIQAEDAVVRPRHLARPGEVPTADQPHTRDRLRRRATRAGRDQRRAGAGAAGDAVEARGLEGLGHQKTCHQARRGINDRYRRVASVKGSALGHV
jgi:hypothetical protein